MYDRQNMIFHQNIPPGANHFENNRSFYKQCLFNIIKPQKILAKKLLPHPEGTIQDESRENVTASGPPFTTIVGLI